MIRRCEFCDEPILDGSEIRFIGHGTYKQLPSKVTYAIGRDFHVESTYHPDCLDYVIGGGKQ